MRFSVAWSAAGWEKWLDFAWKSFVSGPFRCYAALAGSTGSSLASERKIYSSGKRSDIRQTTKLDVIQLPLLDSDEDQQQVSSWGDSHSCSAGGGAGQLAREWSAMLFAARDAFTKIEPVSFHSVIYTQAEMRSNRSRALFLSLMVRHRGTQPRKPRHGWWPFATFDETKDLFRRR